MSPDQFRKDMEEYPRNFNVNRYIGGLQQLLKATHNNLAKMNHPKGVGVNDLVAQDTFAV